MLLLWPSVNYLSNYGSDCSRRPLNLEAPLQTSFGQLIIKPLIDCTPLLPNPILPHQPAKNLQILLTFDWEFRVE